MKIICVGRNYVDHIEELKNKIPNDPVIFFKPTITLNSSSIFKMPNFSSNIQHEIEVIFEVGKEGKKIDESDSLSHISRVGIGIDFTARDIQNKNKKNGLPWAFAKSFDDSCTISRLLNINNISDINNIDFSLSKNGIKVQHSNTNLMIFNIKYLIYFISQKITIEKGDIIFTGTPKGVGKISKSDKLEGFINNEKILSINIY